MFLSSDNGVTWTSIDSLANKSFTTVATSPGVVLAGTGAGIYVSRDQGSTWSLSDSGLTNLSVTGFAVTGPGIFAGTNGGGVFLSTDNGATWKAMNSGLTNTGITCLEANGQNLYAGTSKGPYLSTTNGASWGSIVTGLSNSAANTLAANGSLLFVGTPNGVYLSIDNGTTWTPLNNGLPAANTNVTSMAILGSDVFAGMSGGGIFRGSLSEITGVQVSHTGVPGGYALSQNYPNPFNPTTVISYRLPEPGVVSLRVYDVLGREVATLVEGRQSVGNHEVEFNGSRFASGVYFYRLISGRFSETKKMLMLK
ncbi:MAG: hypothetical protein B7Z63_01725 [Ignavibacteriae bacterium 37-53-5]|nr:MAG: hypothetical protein B7Z63_01725 [Ignavibacteriae bacterium 37-53-5]